MSYQHPMFASKAAALPYRGTAGSSGSTASQDMAAAEAADGTMAERQRIVMNALALAGPRGETVADLRDGSKNHHGKMSSALTALHKTGKIARLTLRRDRCSIYVLPEHVEGRTTVPPGGNKQAERPLLSPAEVEFVAKVRGQVYHRTADNTLMQTSTMRALFDMIEYLNG